MYDTRWITLNDVMPPPVPQILATTPRTVSYPRRNICAKCGAFTQKCTIFAIFGANRPDYWKFVYCLKKRQVCVDISKLVCASRYTRDIFLSLADLFFICLLESRLLLAVCRKHQS